MMRLIISMESGSLNHELLKFFEYDSSVPTGSAFYQQRSKLSVSAFRHLLKEFNLKFPLEKFRGKYYLIACDGSEFNIARNPNNPDTFHEPNGKSLSGFNMVHTISLYEVCSKRYCDSFSACLCFFFDCVLVRISSMVVSSLSGRVPTPRKRCTFKYP